VLYFVGPSSFNYFFLTALGALKCLDMHSLLWFWIIHGNFLCNLFANGLLLYFLKLTFCSVSFFVLVTTMYFPFVI
jgi:hypothetical protein